MAILRSRRRCYRYLLLLALAAIVPRPCTAGTKADLSALRQAAMNRGGDTKRGKAVYLSAAARCTVCHKVHGQGGEVGPDLSPVGGKLDRTYLIEAILDPSAEIPQGYHATVIETRAGRLLTGIVKAVAVRWPKEYRGQYFFGDFNHGTIKVIDPEKLAVARPFATGLHRPVDLRFAADGSLYVLVRDAWVMDRLFQGGTGALLRVRYTGR